MTNQFDRNLHVFTSPEFQSVVNNALTFFVTTPVHQLPLPESFQGAGVYALYYVGESERYAKLAEINREACVQPIYVGKAVPPGWRTGRVRTKESADLYRRINEHKRTLEQASNLEVQDFRCRFMILSDIESDLIVPVEAELIRRYTPLWNTVVDGFGNHDPGKGRYNQAKSDWDVLHPGRAWAEQLTGSARSQEEIVARILQNLA